MEWTIRRLVMLGGGMAFIGSLLFLALTVYPFDYEPISSVLLIGGLFLFVIGKYIMDTAAPEAKG